MPIYDFRSEMQVQDERNANIPLSPSVAPGISQLSHVQGGRTPHDGSDFLAYPYHLEEFLVPAFRALDGGMKQYWTGIRVPTKESYRFMRIKIAGGDKSLLIWADDLNEGRARMPVASISRESHEFNPLLFSPRYHAMSHKHLNRQGNLAARVFRPVPYDVRYNMIIWTEHKRDADYILYQILTRFHPLAEFQLFDGKIAGNIKLKFEGSSDASDKEAGYDQYAKTRYEVIMTAEAWLPLPEQITPTVLGQVRSIRESIGRLIS